jgi:hypothetical protein
MRNKNVITIGISGCSSSGKTTLAIILEEIFAPSNIIGSFDCPEITLSKSFKPLNLSDAKGFGEKPNKKVRLILQEDTYFLDKSFCPRSTFASRSEDAHFVDRTLAQDNVGCYTIAWKGSENCLNDGKDSLVPAAAAAAAASHVWDIVGPDTDCWEAIDVPALIAAVQHIQMTGELSQASIARVKNINARNPDFLVVASQQDSILQEHRDLVDQMKERVNVWLKEHSGSSVAGPHKKGAITTSDAKAAVRPTFCFVEGFLLFPSPRQSASSDSNKENVPPVQHCEPVYRASPPDQREEILAFQTQNAFAKHRLMSNLDIKLFLPTSKEVAQSRRFQRDCYIDEPIGKRIPGQMWKTAGYFHEVVWSNYVKEHAWLFEGGKISGEQDNEVLSTHNGDAKGKSGSGQDNLGQSHAATEPLDHSTVVNENNNIGRGLKTAVVSDLATDCGIHVRPIFDAGINDTVAWAVNVILSELGAKLHATTSTLADVGPAEPITIHHINQVSNEGVVNRDQGSKGSKKLRAKLGKWKEQGKLVMPWRRGSVSGLGATGASEHVGRVKRRNSVFGFGR